MKIHYTLDDSAARLPLDIRSADQARDRATELRNSTGVQLVELATQHMVGTGAALTDELVYFFEHDSTPSESDPYAVAHYYENRDELADLLRDVRDLQPGLVALHEVTELFPIDFEQNVQFTLALTVVGYPAFGYVRTYKDSEGEEFHGMVVNLAHARPHIETLLGHYSRAQLVNTIRHGFFNHEGFLLAYNEYVDSHRQSRDRASDRLKHGLLSRGIAWYLSYRHDLALYDEALEVHERQLPAHVSRYNDLLSGTGKKRAGEASLEDWPQAWKSHEPGQNCIDVVGYFAARAIAHTYGDDGLRESIVKGPDHFIKLYNGLDNPPIKDAR